MKRPAFHITVTEGVDRGKVFALKESDITIGRKFSAGEEKPGCILLEDATVSREHGVLHWNDYKKTYGLRHRSHTNPTRVNGKITEECLLEPGDVISMGDVSFVFDDESPEADSSDMIYSGIKLLVIEGENKDETFTPSRRRVLIGRRGGAGTVRRDAGIILDDETIGENEALLIWNDSDKRYSLSSCQSRKAPKISRVDEGATQPRLIRVDKREFILPQDLLIIGNTILMVMQDERLLETFKGQIPEKRKQERPPAPPPPPPAPQRITPRVKEPPSAEEQAKHSFPRKVLPAPTHKPTPSADIFSKDKGAPPENLFQEHTSAWKVQPDFEIEIVEKSERRERIAFLRSALAEGRTIPIGKGEASEIELRSREIAGVQALLKFSGGKFYLVSRSLKPPNVLNGSSLQIGEEAPLASGDRLAMGDVNLFFFDRSAGLKECLYSLEITEGVRWEKGRSYPLRETALIGRSLECSIQLADTEVSRVHCRIRTEGDSCFLTHLSATNPTFINGVSLPPERERRLSAGDALRLSSATVLTLVKTKRDHLDI